MYYMYAMKNYCYAPRLKILRSMVFYVLCKIRKRIWVRQYGWVNYVRRKKLPDGPTIRVEMKVFLYVFHCVRKMIYYDLCFKRLMDVISLLSLFPCMLAWYSMFSFKLLILCFPVQWIHLHKARTKALELGWLAGDLDQNASSRLSTLGSWGTVKGSKP